MNATRTLGPRGLLAVWAILASLACGGAEDAPNASAAANGENTATAMSIAITQPEDGSEVQGGSVTMVLEATGLEIVPAGVDQPRSGHHHLIVNGDLPAMDLPIPVVPGESIHMGQAQTEFELTDLAAGEYRVIAVVGDHLHVPLTPLVSDTVHFTVRE